MGHTGRQKKNLAFVYRYILQTPFVIDFQGHIAFHLIKELFTAIDMIISSFIGSADDHDDKFAVFPNKLIADRRFEQMTILVYPALKVDCLKATHRNLQPPTQPVGFRRQKTSQLKVKFTKPEAV
jgi:hypothetical protein